MLSWVICPTAQVIWVSIAECLCCNEAQAWLCQRAITAGVDIAGKDTLQSSLKNVYFS